jgi:cation:H+ antiporter
MPWTPTIPDLTSLPAWSLLQWVAGLLLLIGGAELLVRAAVGLAAGWGVRPLIIGLTLIGLCSSAPQLTVSLQAVFSETPDIAVGSVLGSTVFNLLVTLGLAALLTPLRVSRPVVRLDIPMMIGAAALVFGLAIDQRLGRLDGFILMAGLALYMALVWRQSRYHARPCPKTPVPTEHPWGRGLGLLVVGVALLAAGGRVLLDAALELALDYGLSDRIIGLTIVAIGASMPELATSLIAARRGQRDLAVGNVIGSSLFNLLGVLGLTAVLAPGPLSISPNALDFDLPVMLAVAALCWPLFYAGYRIGRLKGLVMLGLYLAYGVHVLAFATGLPLAGQVQHLMLYYVLPPLGLVLAVQTLRAWRRQR